MGTPFLGEIRIFSFGFAPAGWAQCDGQLLSINQNQALYSLMGNFYGGNGTTNFALPDFRGKVSIHADNAAYPVGRTGGALNHTLSLAEMPAHTHQLSATANAATTPVAGGNVLARANATVYYTPGSLTPLSPAAVVSGGGSQSHTNTQPYLVLNFCVALTGLFPSQN